MRNPFVRCALLAMIAVTFVGCKTSPSGGQWFSWPKWPFASNSSDAASNTAMASSQLPSQNPNTPPIGNGYANLATPSTDGAQLAGNDPANQFRLTPQAGGPYDAAAFGNQGVQPAGNYAASPTTPMYGAANTTGGLINPPPTQQPGVYNNPTGTMPGSTTTNPNPYAAGVNIPSTNMPTTPPTSTTGPNTPIPPGYQGAGAELGTNPYGTNPYGMPTGQPTGMPATGQYNLPATGTTTPGRQQLLDTGVPFPGTPSGGLPYHQQHQSQTPGTDATPSKSGSPYMNNMTPQNPASPSPVQNQPYTPYTPGSVEVPSWENGSGGQIDYSKMSS